MPNLWGRPIPHGWGECCDGVLGGTRGCALLHAALRRDLICTLHSSGGRIEIEVILERLQAVPRMAGNGEAAAASAAATHTPARLLVGSCHDDRLLSITC